MRKWGSACLAGLLIILTLAACSGGGNNASGVVELEFFQNKPEAKGTFDKLVAKFNEEHPNIHVSQVNPPDAETVLKTRVVKDDIPDIIGLGATDTYSLLAQSEIFLNLTNDPLLQNIDPKYVQMLTDVTGMQEVTGVPFALNASGVIYNKEIFQKLGLSVPKTWDELIATAKKAKEADVIPFYFTYKDDWQTNLPFNDMGGTLVGIDFYKERRENKTTFLSAYQEVAKKQLELLNYGHSDNFGKSYADGNRAFGNGEAAMYIQGSWAISEIRKVNPDIDLGFFPLPASNDEAQNKLTAGVDTLLAISNQTEHPEEAKQFIAFLLQPENSQQYINEQNLFSAVDGVQQKDESVTGLLPYFEQGKIVDFVDHYIPSAVQLNPNVQAFLQNKDIDAFLGTLDKEWDKVAARRAS
ncbi:ABC transporter substrate-binding protein [Paenibacillus wulumuqiensis]|uniref:ABC transporter substrate-binding protein n=1 Tax=Paenibacillus wulumuqiensis TaxID=1567107 RepID=UPI0006199455|nr:extracellular solute-binding protein [Paenibacillus wulumuqiensis]